MRTMHRVLQGAVIAAVLLCFLLSAVSCRETAHIAVTPTPTQTPVLIPTSAPTPTPVISPSPTTTQGSASTATPTPTPNPVSTPVTSPTPITTATFPAGGGGAGEVTPQPSQTPISSPIPTATPPPPAWWPIRDFPDNTVQPTETFDVVLTFAAPWDSFNSIEIVDNVPPGWAIQVDKAWCTPDADSHDVTANQAQYTWYGPYGAGQTFSALYKVTVPGNTSSSSYEFTGHLAYKFGNNSVTFVTTGGYRQVTVEVPTPTPVVTPTPVSMEDVELYVKAVDPEASEIGPDPGRFYIYTEQPLCGQPSGHCADGWQKICYTIEGTAQNGVDYEQIPGCVYALVGYPIVPPPSDAPAEYIDIRPIPDNVVEGNETVRLVLANGRSAQVIIRDGPRVTPPPMHTLN